MSPTVVAILALWLALSIANQFRFSRFGWSRRVIALIDRVDICFVVPDYAFFAPVPLTFDHEVLYRDRLVDGAMTPWCALPLRSTSAWRPLWNPRKRTCAIARDSCIRLLQEAQLQIGGDRRGLELFVSAPYVGIAHRVAAAPHSVAGRETQFAVAISAGFEARKAPAVAVVSPFFRL